MYPSYLVLLHAKISLLHCDVILSLGFYRGWIWQAATEEWVGITGEHAVHQVAQFPLSQDSHALFCAEPNSRRDCVSWDQHTCCLGRVPYLLGSEKFRNEMQCDVYMVSPDSRYNEISLLPVGCSIICCCCCCFLNRVLKRCFVQNRNCFIGYFWF